MFSFRTSVLALLTLLAVTPARAATVGQAVPAVTIRDANDKPASIPDFGTKVMAIFISDPDQADLNDTFADTLKAANLDESKYRGVGVAELKDTILPNSMVRAIIRGKIEKYDATILTDVDHTLTTKWGLGSLNGSGAVVILDKKGVVQFVKTGKLSSAEVTSGLELVKRLIAE